jgi:thymidylate kinase
MKSILYILVITFISSNLYAETKDDTSDILKKIAERKHAQYEREKAKSKKEFNDPHNKYIRELEKKHYGKVVNGDKEQQKLHQDIVNSVKN